MSDAWHEWGSDLSIGPTGDLQMSGDQDLAKQRILRRLLTNPGSYLWQLDYGGGLGAFIGGPVRTDEVQSTIIEQLGKEQIIAQRPEATVTVAPVNALGAGAISVQIQYESKSSPSAQVLKFSVPAI